MNAFISKLLACSSGYLLLPYLIFFLGYLRWPIALLLCGCAISGYWAVMRDYRHFGQHREEWSVESDRPFSLVFFITLAVGVLAILLISGIGGYGYQDHDWFKHNAILSALIDSPWPAAYTFSFPERGIIPIPLVYYIAYYLPAAIIGKAWGWYWANQALFLWTYIGLYLSLLWFAVLVKQMRLGTLGLFLAFSGLDVLGIIWVRFVVLQQPLFISRWTHIERWSGNWEYQSWLSLVFWVPGQAIVGWICGGIIFYTLTVQKRSATLLFFLSLTALWSPFLTVGFFPFLLADLACEKTAFTKKIRAYCSLANVCGSAMLLVCVAYFAARSGENPTALADIANGLIFFHPLVPNLPWQETLTLMILFWCLECGVYVWGIHSSKIPLTREEHRLFLVAVGMLAILPLFRYGYWNDLAMRASIPSLFVLCWFTVKVLYHPQAKRWVVIWLLLTLAIGSLNSMIEVKRHFKKIAEVGTLIKLPTPHPLYKAPDTVVNPSFFSQYVGNADTFFFRYLTKPMQSTPPILTINDIRPLPELVEGMNE